VAVTSASTDTEVEAAIEDNADYDLVASVSKAQLYIHAATCAWGFIPAQNAANCWK